jgi:hypothetical protein
MRRRAFGAYFTIAPNQANWFPRTPKIAEAATDDDGRKAHMKLKTETNTPEMEKRILAAFAVSGNRKPTKQQQTSSTANVDHHTGWRPIQRCGC